MPFGFGKKKDEAPAAVAAEAVVQPVVGTSPCSERGCDRQDGAACEYIDRRGRRCATAWCAEHQALFDGHAFCRRHVGTLRAIGVDVVDRSLAPDLDNRAPSLVNWICNDLDPRVRAFLQSEIKEGSGEEMAEERVHLIRTQDGTRTWERSWKLFDHTGVTTRVCVNVNEANDAEVIVRLGRERLIALIPPWIDRRMNRITIPEEQDTEERRIFYDYLYDIIVKAVNKERHAPRW